MSKFPQETLDRANNSTTITNYLEARGIQVRKQTRNGGMAFCPFHENTRDEAFSIFDNCTGWKCHGVCAEGGDLIKLHQKFEGIDFRTAVLQLIGEVEQPKSVQIAIRKPKPVNEPENDMLPVGADLYRNGLKSINHPYPVAKKIDSGVLREVGARQNGERLIIPLISSGEIVQYQLIWPDKKRTYGTHKTGGSITIGELIDGDIILIAEGFATGASAYQASTFSTICAMTADRLPVIAKAVRRKFPNSPIGLICDNDESGKGQSVCYPLSLEISNCKLIMSNVEGEDMNDLYCREGQQAVHAKIKKAMSKVYDFNYPVEFIKSEQDNINARIVSDELKKAALFKVYG